MAAAAQAVKDMLNGRDLDVWVEVRDSVTGEALYSFLGAARVRNEDEVTVTHRVGDVQVLPA
jgi:hypothetical protein